MLQIVLKLMVRVRLVCLVLVPSSVEGEASVKQLLTEHLSFLHALLVAFGRLVIHSSWTVQYIAHAPETHRSTEVGVRLLVTIHKVFIQELFRFELFVTDFALPFSLPDHLLMFLEWLQHIFRWVKRTPLTHHVIHCFERCEEFSL